MKHFPFIFQIILVVIIYYLKNKLSGLSALFEESGKCMMNLPGLIIAPLLAFIVLAIFLAFWVLVVICIATASAPGDKNPFAPLDNTHAHASTTDVTITNKGSKSKYNFGIFMIIHLSYIKYNIIII